MYEPNLDACLTTGWPFLQAGAFLGRDGEDVIIVLNEAEDGVLVKLVGGLQGEMMMEVEPHAVKTLVTRRGEEKD